MSKNTVSLPFILFFLFSALSFYLILCDALFGSACKTFVSASTQPNQTNATLNINEMEYVVVFFCLSHFCQLARYISAAIHSLSTFNTSLLFFFCISFSCTAAVYSG